MVQNGRENADVKYGSITTDSDMQNDILQQRLIQVSRQREELQQMEVELRAQVIVRSKIIEIQNRYENQMEEHANETAMLQVEYFPRELSYVLIFQFMRFNEWLLMKVIR